MPHCIVVADDLTGANATGVLLKKQGFETMTVLREAQGKAAALTNCDCLVLPTDSRAIAPEEAYLRVKQALETVRSKDIRLYAKRIDSTLRGNLGSETDAFLDVLGEDALAVCVPVFPSSGRVLVGSHLMVNGVALRHTEAAHDPKCPVSASNALDILRGQTRRQVEAICLDRVSDGADALKDTILTHYHNGVRVLLVDSVTMGDLETIAEALHDVPFPLVTVDPGPFSAIMLKRLSPPAEKKRKAKVICAIGSVNGVAAAQARRLLSSLPVTAVLMEAERVLQSGVERQAEINRIISELLARKDESNVLAVVGNGIDPAKKLPLDEWSKKLHASVEKLSEKINDAFAEIILQVMEQDADIRGLYSTGGDITAAIHRRAGTVALRLLEEVVPLAAFAQISGGALDSMYCVSKGGMVGDENAIVTCISYLQDRLTEEF